MDPRLEVMVEAARAGGAVALEHYRRGFTVSLKADRSLVTEADRAAEGEIVGTRGDWILPALTRPANPGNQGA